MTVDVPANVHALLESRVNTFEKLELIVTLRGASRSVLSLAELASSLDLDRGVVYRAAVELRAAALVEIADREVRLVPLTTSDQDAVAELVRLYAEDRLVVVKTLGDIATQRIRTMASQVFGESFVLRKKP